MTAVNIKSADGDIDGPSYGTKKPVPKPGQIHERFLAKDEVIEIIHRLKSVHTDLIKTERAIERFTFIVDEYQEQPHLIDPYLEEIIDLIISVVRQPDCEEGHRYLLFTCLHLLSKMRGYKVVVRYLPHEVSDVETVLELLLKQDPLNVQTWQNRYCLLLWLSMVSMIPFDLVRLDNTAGDGDSKLPVMDRIINLGKLYLCVTDKSSDAAAFMLAKFLTRPDVKKRRMADVIDWALTSLTSSVANTAIVSNTNAVIGGILGMLGLLYQMGARADLIPYAGKILQVVTHEPKVCYSLNIMIRKLGVKLIQRIGLIYLKARVASWRYSRGNRSIAANLAGTSQSSLQQNTTPLTNDDDDDDYDLPDEIEEIIEHLLSSLKDKDTIVRWSAAKGIGRITGRLPKELADDVIENLLQLFTIQETDAAWHGGCLALAELGRRGLLLPQRLSEVIPVIKRSLNYDEKKGFCSIGAHIRDAACYVCWSFARAYEPDLFREYAKDIASALLIVAVFDREVNVRRAASAAFQENVGRQGTFPHGIDIVTTCDYFAVGHRSNAYLKLSKFVAGFSDYTRPLIDHLIEYKIKHWASNMRVLSSEALHNLVPLDTLYFSSVVLPKLLPMATGPDLNTRHGALHSIGQVCLSLSTNGVQIDSATISTIADIVPTLRSRKMLLGLGGEYMRKSICSLISDVSLTNLFANNPVVECWQKLLDECLTDLYMDVEVQEAAGRALPNFLQFRGEGDESTKETIVQDYINTMLTATHERSLIGSMAALGSLPKSFLTGRLNRVLSALIMRSRKIGENDKDWPDSRKEAFKSIDRICTTVGIEAEGTPTTCICRANIDEIYEAYLLGLLDYTIDSRGDIGACVREACMSGLHSLTTGAVYAAPQLLSQSYIVRMFTMIAQQACEKIDRTRDHAGTILSSLLYNEPEVPYIPCRQTLVELFPNDENKPINFGSPSTTFPKFSEMLNFDVYRYNILLGFTVSVGGLTESIVKHSHSALLNHIQSDYSLQEERLKNMCSSIILIFSRHVKVDRVTIPLMKMTGQLLTSGVFDEMAEDTTFEFPPQLLEAVKAEIVRCGDPQKLLTSGEVLCGLLQFEGVIREKCLLQLSIFLCHKFPIVRKTTANSLYECLLTNEDVITEDSQEEVMALLSDNDWDEPVEKLRPIRNQLCTLFGIKPPVIKKK